jgi:hypothetical protein
MRAVWTGALGALALAGAARADVAQQWDGGFTLKSVVQVAAKPDRAYAALGEIGRWWANDHTYSGKAANLTTALKAGACWCEAWAGGGVEHGRVLLASPPLGTLRYDAALGPLQGMGVTGRLTYEIKAKDAGAEVVQTYTVSGGPAGLAKQIAGGVDAVMSEALARYRRYVDTGTPE